MKIDFVKYCPFCNKRQVLKINNKDLMDWKMGKLIQDAFPYLNANEREVLKTGICPSCWNDMFPKEGGDSDEY